MTLGHGGNYWISVHWRFSFEKCILGMASPRVSDTIFGPDGSTLHFLRTGWTSCVEVQREYNCGWSYLRKFMDITTSKITAGTTLTVPLSPDGDDVFEWVAGDSPLRVFRSSTTWEVLRPRQEKQDWVDIIWFKGAVPKHSFTMWVMNYDRLPTRSRFAGWGMMVSAKCAFCSRYDETRDHLMLTCEYSQYVWTEVLRRCQSLSTPLTNWSDNSCLGSPSKKLTLLRKLAFQTTIFHR